MTLTTARAKIAADKSRLRRWYTSCEVPQDTYTGARALLLPGDLLLSYLAKRSYPMYRLWDRWSELTRAAFPRNALRAVETSERFRMSSSILQPLRAEGIVRIPNAFPEAWIVEAREFVLSRYKEVSARSDMTAIGNGERQSWYDGDGVLVECDPAQGRYRFVFPTGDAAQRRLPDPIREFIRLPVTHAIVECYYGSAATPCRPYAMAEVLVPGSEVQQWHIDCLRKGVKAFLYLNDVTEAQGPLRYLLATHLPDGERHRQLYRVGRRGLAESYFDDGTNTRFDSRATVLTGSANTLILFDNRGIHAGSLCTQGMRIALVNGFRPAYGMRINPRLLPNLPAASDHRPDLHMPVGRWRGA